jgi:D-alanine-D-alanine ligase
MSGFADRRCARISPADKARLRVMLLAKHACSRGLPDPVDGNHAIYHHELRTTLEQIGLNITPANCFEAILDRPEVDFVFPLLNRAGFQNSEMLAPLLLARRGVPFLGASPILRGLADDKHLSKVAAQRLGVPTAPWISLRRGAPIIEPRFPAERLVVKPNASSASWGVHIVESWAEGRRRVDELQAQGHDVIVEKWLPLLDIAAPVIGGAGPEPWLLPPMAHQPESPGEMRSYEEKRALVPGLASDPLRPVEDVDVAARIEAYAMTLIAELWPFDYGRFEFRFDPASGEISFMEVNLSCNLWSRKSISRAAATLGIDHAMLVESIVAHSMARQGVISPAALELAA